MFAQTEIIRLVSKMVEGFLFSFPAFCASLRHVVSGVVARHALFGTSVLASAPKTDTGSQGSPHQHLSNPKHLSIISAYVLFHSRLYKATIAFEDEGEVKRKNLNQTTQTVDRDDSTVRVSFV